MQHKHPTAPFRSRGLWLATALVAMTAVTLRAETRTWVGPSNADWFAAANWLPEGAGNNYPQAGDAVIITNGFILLTNETANLASFSITNATLNFTNWTTALRATQVNIWSNGNLTHAPVNTNLAPGITNRVWIVCSGLSLNAGGKVNVDDCGYARNQGPGKGRHSIAGLGSGAGHGGSGGPYWYYDLVGGGTCGLSNAPVLPGSGGGGGNDANPSGGRGGGVVRIEATGTVTINGNISANGGVGTAGIWSYPGGGGAGGSIYITCDTFEGTASGVLRARGGAGGYSTEGGGGGRIAVAYTNLGATQTMAFDTMPGNTNVVFGWQEGPQWGTLHLSDTRLLPPIIDNRFGYVKLFMPQPFTNWAPGSLTVSNGCIEFQDGFIFGITNEMRVRSNARLVVVGGTLTCGTHITLDQGGRLFLKKNFEVHCGGDLLVTNNSALFVYGGPTNGLTVDYGGLVSVTGRMTVAPGAWIYPFSDQTNGGSVLFRMNELQILTNSGFNATGRGYLHRNSKGPGTGKNTSGDYGSGGGYGGKGGSSLFLSGGTNYGSAYAPIEPGSGGGGRGDGTMNTYAGGGAVRVEARGNIAIHGTIVADGNNGDATGGGSGGGIYLVGNSLEGAALGSIQAKGGTGSATIGGGGGGGRVAVWIGISDSARQNYIVNGISNRVIRSSIQPKEYLGSVSVTNGTGYTNLPPVGSVSGTCWFFTADPPTGVMVQIQ